MMSQETYSYQVGVLRMHRGHVPLQDVQAGEGVAAVAGDGTQAQPGPAQLGGARAAAVAASP